jgi:hypothetical protein
MTKAMFLAIQSQPTIVVVVLGQKRHISLSVVYFGTGLLAQTDMPSFSNESVESNENGQACFFVGQA